MWPADVATPKTSDRELSRGEWEGTLEGLHEDGTDFTAHVVMTRRCGKTGMPIGFLVSSSGAMDGVWLEVEIHRTRAYGHPALQSVPDAMLLVSASDERGLANAETAILLGDSHEGAGRSPVEMLIADRYLDLHPGLRMGFFSESWPHPTGSGPEGAVQSQTGSANCYVRKLVEFDRCCDVVRTMRLLWIRESRRRPSGTMARLSR